MLRYPAPNVTIGRLYFIKKEILRNTFLERKERAALPPAFLSEKKNPFSLKYDTGVGFGGGDLRREAGR